MTGGVAGYENTHGVAEERRDETWTQSADLDLEITASVTTCQVRIKGCELNGLRARSWYLETRICAKSGHRKEVQ